MSATVRDAPPQDAPPSPSDFVVSPPPETISASPLGVVRGTGTGVVLGAFFVICNIYIGLKVGLTLNVSIPAAILCAAFWQLLRVGPGKTRAGMAETNLAQTAASSAAAVASAGLVTSIPAYFFLSTTVISWPALTLWMSAVCLLGIAAAALLRDALIDRQNLTFAVGVASAATVQELHDASGRARERIGWLLGAALTSMGIAALSHRYLPQLFVLKPLAFDFALAGQPAAAFGWGWGWSPLLLGVGGLIGLRVAFGIMLGATLAYGWLLPTRVARGEVRLQSEALRDWASWPGATLLVVGSLIGFAISYFRVLRHRSKERRTPDAPRPQRAVWFWASAAVLLVSLLAWSVFAVPLWLAFLSAALALFFAMIAGRVVGDVPVTPNGPLAKASQILVGILRPEPAAPNIIASNITVGAAAQCADLLHDLKCGRILNVTWRQQVFAQIAGAVAGALVGCAFLLFLFTNADTRAQLEEWALPGVKPVQIVATLFAEGQRALPPNIFPVICAALAAGAALACAEALAPVAARRWIPSVIGIGFGFLLGPGAALVLLVGAAAAALVQYLCPNWSRRLLVLTCSGLVIGGVSVDIALPILMYFKVISI